MLSKTQIGNYGEDIACSYIEQKGLKIIERNYRCEFGEIDIIAYDNEYIVFIEVKYRKSLKFGYPSEAVNKKKQTNIKNSAIDYVSKKEIKNIDFRFDVLEVLHIDNIKVRQIKNAFY